MVAARLWRVLTDCRHGGGGAGLRHATGRYCPKRPLRRRIQRTVRHLHRHQCDLDPQHDGGVRLLRSGAPNVRCPVQRLAPAGHSHRFLLWRAAGSAGRRRHADRDRGGDAGGPGNGSLEIRGVRAGSRHGPSRLRSPCGPDYNARRGHRPAVQFARCDGRPPDPGYSGRYPTCSGMGRRRPSWPQAGMARSADHRPCVRRRSVRVLQLHFSPALRHRCVSGRRRRARGFFGGLETKRDRGDSPCRERCRGNQGGGARHPARPRDCLSAIYIDRGGFRGRAVPGGRPLAECGAGQVRMARPGNPDQRGDACGHHAGSAAARRHGELCCCSPASWPPLFCGFPQALR